MPKRDSDTEEPRSDGAPTWDQSVTVRTAKRADGTDVRLGSDDDAGLLSTTKRAPHGVQGASYRRMIGYAGAPGPWTNPETGHPSRNPITGELEYDLDAVEAWNKSRPGSGSYHRDIERRTPLRHTILAAIEHGEISVVIRAGEVSGLRAGLTRNGQPFDGRGNTRVLRDLDRAGHVTIPAEGGKVAITESGAELLARWDAEAPRPRELTDADRAEIVKLVAGGMSQVEAGERFGIRQPEVSALVRAAREG